MTCIIYDLIGDFLDEDQPLGNCRAADLSNFNNCCIRVDHKRELNLHISFHKESLEIYELGLIFHGGNE